MRELKNGITRKQQSELIKAYLLDAIYSDESEGHEAIKTDKDKINFIYDTFVSEKLGPNKGYYKNTPIQAVFADWLMGLPSVFNIDFEDSEIESLAIKWGSLPANPSDAELLRIRNNWFNFIGFKFISLRRKINK